MLDPLLTYDPDVRPAAASHHNEAALPSRSNTLAVVVTYHPDGDAPSRAAAALEHAGRLLVVDNTPGDAPAVLARLAETPSIDVHRMGHNAGIASALNHGLSKAVEAGCTWVLFLDQDTTLWSVYGDVVRRAVDASGPRVGLVGVNFLNEQSGRPYTPPQRGVTEAPFVVNSGTMLRVECASEIGGFRDDFFIDYVDIEYGLRARRHGFAVMLASELAMSHGMGEVAEHHVLGYARQTSNYRPVRHYYMARNSLATMRTYGATERAWARKELTNRLKLLALTLAMEPGRGRALAGIASGYADGIRKRMGEAPRWLSSETRPEAQ